MNFNENIKIEKYSGSANRRFNEMEKRLTEIEGGFQSRMNGKTNGKLIGSLVGTILWFALFVILSLIFRAEVNPLVLVITVIVLLALIAFMLIDNITSFSYYGNIASYQSAVTKLKDRVAAGKSAIKSNNAAFMASRKNGWNHQLNPASSIPDEAISIESTMANMESLKKGFINTAKNVMFFAAAVMITVAGCTALFPLGEDIICGISSQNFDDGTLLIMNIVAMVIVGVGEIILAKLVWSKTNCTVNNITLFILLAAPLAYLALVALVTGLVVLVIAIVKIAVYIIGIVIVGAIVFGCLCGG